MPLAPAILRGMERIDSEAAAAPLAVPEGLRVGPVTPLPERLAVGGGTALLIDGRCSHPDAPIERLAVIFDGVEMPASGWGMPLPEHVEGDGYWWVVASVERIEAPRLAWVELRATLNEGRVVSGRLGAIELTPELEAPRLDARPRSQAASEGRRGDDSVAICMATHEPPLDLFERQIESIRAQSHDDWVCLISDDASSPETLAGIQAILDGDPRFALSVAELRQGFYGSFERALSLVPADVRYVALSDQDDRWRPEKLTRLIAAIDGGARLAYSDMRVVDAAGKVLSETYWSHRRNNHTDFASLLLANTITGAASLFDRALLADVLPFPPPVGNAYHDHWIAEVALALGEISYVDEPLYDYVQHDAAALGHLRANNVGPAEARRDRAARLAARVRRDGFHPGWRAFYFNLTCRTAVNLRALELRCGERMAPDRLRAMRRVRPAAANVPWLLARSARRSVAGSSETLGREAAMLRGLAWRGLSEARSRSRRLGRRREGGAEAREGATSDTPLKPILLDYFTRDGSTLMMRLLASSPQIAIEDVYPFERKYFAYLWRWAMVLDRGEWRGEEWGPESLGSLDELRAASLVGPPPWQPRPLLEPGPGEAELSRRAFELVWGELSRRVAERAVASGAEPPRYTAEKHLNTWLVPLEQLPPHELIVLLRDPRDSWVSMRTFEQGESFGGEHRESEERLLEHVLSRQRERLRWIAGLIEAGEVPVIRYEDLVLDLDGVAARLAERLGVQLDPAAVRADRETRRRHMSAASPEASIGRWRDELPGELAATFAVELGRELRALGFEA